MAIFGKSDQQTNYADNVTTIAAGSSLTGKIEIESTLHIDGEFNGEIHSTNIVSIGKSGVVKSDLKAKKLVVSGKFSGNADCDSIELLSGGEIEGQLTAASLAINSDAFFQGQSIRRKPGEGTNVVDFADEPASSSSGKTTV